KTKNAASRTSRHKKKYWRKGTDVGDVERLLHGKTSGSVAHKKDDELFAIDRTPNEPKQYTRRQQAALDKISRSISEEKQALPAPKFPTKKQPKLKKQVKRNEEVKAPQQKQTYDLWEKGRCNHDNYNFASNISYVNLDFVPKVDIEFKEAGEHLLRYTKKKLPNMPSTCRFKPSLLDAVAVPDAGASYNPKADDYQVFGLISLNLFNFIRVHRRRVDLGIFIQLIWSDRHETPLWILRKLFMAQPCYLTETGLVLRVNAG
ncbi:hypothetical protein COOONC_15030, partial [Cooperia oncophora]